MRSWITEWKGPGLPFFCFLGGCGCWGWGERDFFIINQRLCEVLRPLMNEMSLEIVIKIIQMHFELFSRSWWWSWYWISVWYCECVLEIIMIIKLSWRFWDGCEAWDLEIIKWSWRDCWRFWNVVWDLEIIKMELEILECDLRSCDHQMELEILECSLRSWSSNGVGDFGMWFEILWSSNGVGDSWRFWNVVGDHDRQIEWWEIVKTHHDHYWLEIVKWLLYL